MYANSFIFAKILLTLAEHFPEDKVNQWLENAEVIKSTDDELILFSPSYPGQTGNILDAYFRFNDAVVLSGYGTGGIPEGEYYGFYKVIESWEKKGKTLVVTTQVQQEGSDMNVYRVGRGLKNRFDLLESYSMTYESIITKLMWILAITKDDNEVRQLFYQTVNYDLIG